MNPCLAIPKATNSIFCDYKFRITHLVEGPQSVCLVEGPLSVCMYCVELLAMEWFAMHSRLYIYPSKSMLECSRRKSCDPRLANQSVKGTSSTID